MTLYKLVQDVCNLGKAQPNISFVSQGDIYQLNHNQDIDYPAFIVTQGTHTGSDYDEEQFTLTLFAVDRLVSDKSNEIDVQSWANDVLMDVNYEIYLAQLAKTKLYHCYKNKKGQKIHLSHAGFTLHENDEIPNSKDLLWDREHCWDRCNWWPEENPNDYIVHGHTPTRSSTFKNLLYGAPDQYKLNESATVIRYAHGHKIGIDAGAFSTNKCALLDLDTLQETIFETTD